MRFFGLGVNGRRRPAATPPDPAEFARTTMVEMQLIPRGIVDPRVLEAMRTTPRHLFVPMLSRPHAYEDRPLEIGSGQTISQPFMVAAMTQLLKLGPEDRVLEVGTGSGYQAAVLSKLAARVVTVERIPELAERAARTLASLGIKNVESKIGDGTLGWPELAPYDAIIVTAAGPAVPVPLKEQLAEGGRLVCPVGGRDSQRLVLVTRHGGEFVETEGIGCVFVPLIGAEGWTT